MRYFKDNDFKCKCGCGMDVTRDVKSLADMGRHICGFPWIVTSGARCEAHNIRSKGRKTSAHLKGLAVDVKFHNSYEKFKIVETLIKLGVTRIGINEKFMFVHFDIDTTKPQEVLFKY